VLPPNAPTAIVAVDLLWLDGESLIDVPLLERKRLLESALLDHELVRRTMVVRPPVEAWYGQWRALGFREFAVKGANSRYRPGTVSPHWATQIIPRR
jgi:ATP-dependent DNA ligase